MLSKVKLFSALIFLLSFLSANAKDVNVDSFNNLINNASHDSVKAFEYLRLAEELINTDLKGTFSTAQKALEFSVKSDKSHLELKSLNVLGNVYQRRSNNDSALLMYNQALAIAQENNDTKGFAVVYNNIAIIHTYKGEFEKAIDLYLKALEAEEEINNLQGVAQAYNNIAVVYYQTRNFDKTVNYLDKAAEILTEIGDDMNLKKAYNNLGAIQSYNGKVEEALAYYEKAFAICERLNDRHEMSIVLSNMADCYVDLGKYDEAEKALDKALSIKIDENNYRGISYEYENYASLYSKKGDFKTADEYYNKAIDIAKKHRYLSELRGIYNSYSVFLNKIGEHDKAYEMLKASYVYNDSLINQSTSEAMAELETKYETAKKEQTIIEQERDLAEQELKISQRNRLILALSSTALIIILLGLFVVQRNKRKAQAEKDAAVIAEREEGIRAIFEATENERKRIAGDLHDGIGQQLSGLKLAFSKVSEDIKTKLPEEHEKINKLTDVLDDTCTEVRSISHEMMPKSLGENGLVSAIDDMLAKSLRLTGIEHEFEHHGIKDRFAENIELSVYRICQELINNVVKHSGASHVAVQLYKAGNRLILLVEDNGKGMDEKARKGDGIGLKNMNSRINSVNGDINFEPSPDSGTLATVRVPLPA